MHMGAISWGPFRMPGMSGAMFDNLLLVPIFQLILGYFSTQLFGRYRCPHAECHCTFNRL
jgi:hypothetical protein